MNKYMAVTVKSKSFFEIDNEVVPVGNHHSVHWGINPPPSKAPRSFSPSPFLNLQTVKAHFSGNPPYILVFRDTPLKTGFFSETHNNKIFHP